MIVSHRHHQVNRKATPSRSEDHLGSRPRVVTCTWAAADAGGAVPGAVRELRAQCEPIRGLVRDVVGDVQPAGIDQGTRQVDADDRSAHEQRRRSVPLQAHPPRGADVAEVLAADGDGR